MKSYKETANCVLGRRDEHEKKKKEVIKFSAAFAAGVACLCLAVILGFDLFSEKKPIQIAGGVSSQTDIMPGGDAPISVESKSEGQTQSQESEPSAIKDVYLPNIYINEIDDLPIMSGARLYFDKEKHDFKELTEAEIKDYLKREFVPGGSVRSPLVKKDDASCTLITEKKSGKIVFDIVYLQYANKFYEDGSPLSSSDGGVNLTIYASRLGKPNIDYSWADGKYTELKGVKVYAGKMENGYNYNENKEPTAFYTTYFAEFKVDGVYYEVTADNLSVDEFIRAVWGIIAY